MNVHKQFTETADPVAQNVTADDLALIRRFTRKDVKAEDVYTFPVLLCDNEIDRDLEQFGTEALQTLSELFIGKSGIFDHSMSCRDQTARVYKAECRTDPSRVTQTGEPYTGVYARAYMPRIDKNADLIAEIDSGIKKEVSVGCAVGAKRCSVCGSDALRAPCSHRKGETYEGKLCYHIMEQPTDAYEWSFVAVPAQRNAGVQKHFTHTKGNKEMDTILKSMRDGQQTLTLTPEEQKAFAAKIDALAESAALGKQYAADLADETYRAGLSALPELDGSVLRAVCEKATVPELKALLDCFGTVKKERLPDAAQLCTTETDDDVNHAFQI